MSSTCSSTSPSHEFFGLLDLPINEYLHGNTKRLPLLFHCGYRRVITCTYAHVSVQVSKSSCGSLLAATVAAAIAAAAAAAVAKLRA
eukprot:scaffold220818_cov20-Tisochrysis_lutea.AAC.2